MLGNLGQFKPKLVLGGQKVIAVLQFLEYIFSSNLDCKKIIVVQDKTNLLLKGFFRKHMNITSCIQLITINQS